MKSISTLFAIIGMTASAHAAAILTPGTSITGTTTSLNLSTTTGTDKAVAGSRVTLSNDGGNLLFTPDDASSTDYFVTWNNLSINTNDFRYVQVTFSAIDAGAVDSNWQTFFADGDSTIGGTSNSGHNIGSVTLGTIPLVVAIDMTAFTGTSGGTTGATGWGDTGADTVTALRLDMFENLANNGKTFTISSVVLGNTVTIIPEPSVALLGGLGLLALLRRRRA